ncbi:hypothetical protein ACFP1Z_27080 [Streptomyces gamaensis]|uniref:Uncharacterized protein n=1 Tax=Streptomyces gamaensis TaxID=1763542 RepID=A0ABW0ZB69_9ACTN
MTTETAREQAAPPPHCKECLRHQLAYLTAWRLRENKRAISLYEELRNHQRLAHPWLAPW